MQLLQHTWGTGKNIKPVKLVSDEAIIAVSKPIANEARVIMSWVNL
jgi:hypothetical protein